MAQSKSPESYPDCRLFMDLCLEATKGGKLTFQNKGAAVTFRLRCYTARGRERDRNCRVYEDNHPLYNTSVWHKLVFRLSPGKDDTWELTGVHDPQTAFESIQAKFEEL